MLTEEEAHDAETAVKRLYHLVDEGRPSVTLSVGHAVSLLRLIAAYMKHAEHQRQEYQKLVRQLLPLAPNITT